MKKFSGKKVSTAVFISGRGSNLKSLISFSQTITSPIKIDIVFSNNKNVYWEEPSKTSLSQALFASVGHITVESATALDAAQNSVPTILIGCPGVSNRNKADLYFKEYLDKKIMKFVDYKDVSNLSLDFFLSEFDFQKKNKFLDEGNKNFKNFVEELKN